VTPTLSALLIASEGESTLKVFFFHSLSEVIVTSLASIIVFALAWWKGLPLARKALAARTARIAAEIEEAAKGRATAEAHLAEVQGRVERAGEEHERILVEARETAEALKAQIIARAGEEAEAVLARGAADIEASKRQVIADLQAEVAELAIGAAAAIVARNLDPDTQNELIDGYIEQLGAPT
jgi:F-type H+-transporting ATPase subunit b